MMQEGTDARPAYIVDGYTGKVCEAANLKVGHRVGQNQVSANQMPD